jgi:hypothetical protein
VEITPDARILFSGSYIDTNGVLRTLLARVHADASVDDSFNGDATADLRNYTFAVDSTSRIIIAGAFTQIAGVPRQHIARLLPDGQLDTSFDPGAGPDDAVICLAVQADGKVWIGGGFTHVDGVPWNRIALLNADGSRNTDFDPGTGVQGDETQGVAVYSLGLQSNGDVVIAGSFTNYNGVPRQGLARIHGDSKSALLLLSEGRWNNNQFSFRLQGLSGGSYAVQTSTNLVDWQGWTNVQLFSSSAVLTNATSTNNTAPRFYRAVGE